MSEAIRTTAAGTVDNDSRSVLCLLRSEGVPCVKNIPSSCTLSYTTPIGKASVVMTGVFLCPTAAAFLFSGEYERVIRPVWWRVSQTPTAVRVYRYLHRITRCENLSRFVYYALCVFVRLLSGCALLHPVAACGNVHGSSFPAASVRCALKSPKSNVSRFKLYFFTFCFPCAKIEKYRRFLRDLREHNSFIRNHDTSTSPGFPRSSGLHSFHWTEHETQATRIYNIFDISAHEKQAKLHNATVTRYLRYTTRFTLITIHLCTVAAKIAYRRKYKLIRHVLYNKSVVIFIFTTL